MAPGRLPQARVTPDPDEVEELVLMVLRRFRGTCWRAEREELAQQAHMAIAEAATSWDPLVGVPFPQYAYRAAVVSLGRFLWRTSFAAHVPERQRHEMAKTGQGRGVSLEGLYEVPASLPKALHGVYDPPSLLEHRRWKERVLRAMRLALEDLLGDEAGLVVPVLTGEESPGNVSHRTGVPTKRIHKLTCRARNALRSSRELRLLWEEAE